MGCAMPLPEADRSESLSLADCSGDLLIDTDGELLHVAVAADVLVNLANREPIGLVLRPLVSMPARSGAEVSLGTLDREDAELVDHRVLRLTAAEMPRSDKPAFLIAPVSLGSLECARTRDAVLTELLAISGRAKAKPVVELRDLDGACPGAIAAAVSRLRPATSGVIGQVSADKASIVATAGSGLDGLEISLRPDWNADARQAGRVHELARLCSDVAPRRLAPAWSADDVPALRAAGFDYAVLKCDGLRSGEA